MAAADVQLPVRGALKGEAFTARLAELCKELPPARPLPGLRHRRILAPGMWGGEVLWALQGFLCHALRMRGAEVLCLLCDSFLPACTARKTDHAESACTRWCHRNAGPFARATRLPHRWYSELVRGPEAAACAALAARVAPGEIASFTYRGVDLSEHVLRSLESYFKVARADPQEPAVAAKAREFLEAGMLMTVLAQRAVDRHRPHKILMCDGKKTDWGVFRAVARQRGVPVDVFQMGVRGTSVRFETDRPPAPTARMPEWDRWRRVPLTAAQDRALDAYVRQRRTTPFDNRGAAWRAPRADLREVRRLAGLPPTARGRVFAMFPNLGFDAGKTSAAPAFASAIDWITATVSCFGARPHHHLVIKAHPAEHLRRAEDPVLELLAGRFGALPPNVHTIPPEAGVSAHAVAELSDAALVYTSTMAVEAALLGRPVVLAGGGWNAGRGFTIDVASPAEYAAVLERLCSAGPLPAVPIELARRYAYALFFRSCIPVRHFRMHDLDVRSIDIGGLDELAPGRDPGMDAICRGVLLDEPFQAPSTQ